jgi:flagellar biosynthesis protein FlhA
LEPALEDRVAAGTAQAKQDLSIRVPSSLAEKLCERIAVEVQKLRATSHPEVVLVSPQVRAGLRKLTQQRLPNLNVLSYSEITPDTIVESAGTVFDAEVS